MSALTGIHPVSIFFFVLGDLAFAYVAPPSNVTLHCKNLENILEWDYDQMEPGLRFRVDIKSDYELKECEKQMWVDRPPLQVNLSNPNAVYWLTVKTVLGQNESDPSPPSGIVFTYLLSYGFDTQKCFLDFLSVDVTAHPDNHIEFSFDHPWLLYRQKLQSCDSPKKKKNLRDRSALPDFKYSVAVSGEKEQRHNFLCSDRVCEGRLHVHAAQENHCLRINGELENMKVEPRQEFCTRSKEKSPPDYRAIYVGVGVLCLSAVALIFFMVYRKTTRPDTALPNPLAIIKQTNQPTMLPIQEAVSPIDHYSSSPLLSPTDLENGFTPVAVKSTEDNLRMPLGIMPNTPTDLESGSLNGERSAYMQGNMLEDPDNEETSGDELPPSPYERREVVVVELAPDDRNEGYRG